MMDKIVICIQAVFWALVLWIILIVFLSLGREYTGLKPINYTVKAERVVEI